MESGFAHAGTDHGFAAKVVGLAASSPWAVQQGLGHQDSSQEEVCYRQKVLKDGFVHFVHLSLACCQFQQQVELVVSVSVKMVHRITGNEKTKKKTSS